MTRRFGRFTRPVGRRINGMNGAERAYAVRLDFMKDAGRILEFAFEPERLRITHARLGTRGAKPAWYTPDFRVLTAEGFVEFHEVKGHWEEAAKVRIRVAADAHPYKFVMAQAHGSDRSGYTFDVSVVE